MVDFRQLLSKPVDEAKKLPPLPAGTYHGFIKAQEYGESDKKKTPYCRFVVGLSGPGDDIDQSELAGQDLSKRTFRKDFYLTEGADWRLAEFLKSCHIETSGRSFAETVPEALNASVIVELSQRPSQDGKEVFNDVGDIKGA